MMINDICKKQVLTCLKHDSVKHAAQMMKNKNIGALVVVNETQYPVGIITDRDIALKAVAEGIDGESAKVSELMSRNLLVLDSSQTLQQAIDKMVEKGVRRAPIVDALQKICGLAALDDLLIMLSKCLNRLAGLIETQIKHE